MKNFRYLLTLLTLALLTSSLVSCESSKIAYGNSYYFKQTPKKASVPLKAPEEKKLLASIEKELPEISSVDEKLTASLSHVVALVQANAEIKTSLQREKKELTRMEKKSLRQERRENKREMRKDLKKIVQEYHSSPEVVQGKSSAEQITGNLRTGIILGAVGLILMLLGSGSMLAPIGLLLVVAGLVFILIDVI